MRLLLLSLACLVTTITLADEPAAKLVPDTKGFASIAKPFLDQHCVRCHGTKQQKGEFRIDTQLANDFNDARTVERWGEVLNVVNSHEMPPEDEKQPTPAEAGKFADWVTAELSRAEQAKRSGRIVLRRLNRAEYNNTIRDLLGVDFQPADRFPEDPPAGGFDNNGEALTISPLHLELYYQAARQILDRVLVEGDQPKGLHWRFETEDDQVAGDRTRVKRDGQNVLLNCGKNTFENGMVVIHHNSWDKGVGFRDFVVPAEGEYVIRFRAAGRVPTQAQVVESARKALQNRYEKQMTENPKGEKYHVQQRDRDLKHFEADSNYDYGPPRTKLTVHLGGQPKVVGELDIAASADKPQIYEVRTRFTTQRAGVQFEYAYDIPKVLENFWFQGHDVFARPELMIDWIELEGPLHETWPPKSHSQLLGTKAIGPADEAAAAKTVLQRLMPQAYRRPVTDAEVMAKLALFNKVRAEKSSFVEAIKTPLAAVLTSPHFLYLAEPAAASDTPRKLNAYELASRLSYFLWSSMPDDELTRLAASGELLKPAMLQAQTNRLLKDARSEAFVKNFSGQWLNLRKVGSNPPAENLYPAYDRHLETSIVRESEAFFAEILNHDLPLSSFIKSDFVTINERLARFYKIANVRGDQFRKVSVSPEAHRGGIVTQASILTITSNGTRTSPVSRGTWIMKALLGTDPGLPVANAGEIAPKVPGIDKATVRQRLQIHRELPACARCHNKIDPLGFALENFNAAGEWRDREGFGYNGRIDANDPIINASAKLPDGTEFDGVSGLQEQLLKRSRQFETCLAEKLTTYALGRELSFSDRAHMKTTIDGLNRDGHTLRALIHRLVQSDAFLTK